MSGDTGNMFVPFKQGGHYVVTDLITQVAPAVLGDLSAYFTANPFPIPIAQVTGYTDQTPFVATNIQAEESTTSTSYTNLTTPGPSLTNLPNGTYMVTWGCLAVCSAQTFRAVMALSINNASPDDTKRAQVNSTSLVGASNNSEFTLNMGLSGNSITAQYRVTAAGTGIFGSRYLSATRIGSP